MTKVEAQVAYDEAVAAAVAVFDAAVAAAQVAYDAAEAEAEAWEAYVAAIEAQEDDND
jgi:hypothetical protein